MISAVIADDEEKIIRLIKALGDWDTLGISVIGTASNGLEALDILRRDKVDILITDIRMPGCDGITLIEQVKKISPGTHVIIISGYAEFNYAQAAVKYGVTDYLLKPINRDMLNDALSKIKDNIDHTRQTESRYELSQKKLDTDLGAIRSAFISDSLIDRNKSFTKEELSDQYSISTEGGTFRFICARLDGDISRGNSDFILSKLITILKKDLKDVCADQVYLTSNSDVYGFLSYSSREQEEIKKALKNSLNKVNNYGSMPSESSVTIALGFPFSDLSQTGSALESARDMIKERLVQGTGKLIDYKSEKKVLYEKKYLDRYIRAMTDAVDVWDEEALKNVNEELCGSISECDEADGREIIDTILQAGNAFILKLAISDQTRQLEIFGNKCLTCSSKKQLFDTFGFFTQELMHGQMEMRDDDSDRSIRLAKQYISIHYAEQITLESVSSYLNLTPAYFSSFFKKKTGTGFAKYLMNVRVEAAKGLLKDGNDSISDICTKVGYNDIKHFNRVFEQVTGVKPTVYRKLYG